MPACTCPIPVWLSPPVVNKEGGLDQLLRAEANADGVILDSKPEDAPKHGRYLFKPQGSYYELPARYIPCRKCVNCRLNKCRDMGTRLVHEAHFHQLKCFNTLTYSDEHLPADYSVSPREFQLFMKKLRNAHPETRLRFLACGEYGDLKGRPHYHFVLFGHAFDDRIPWTVTKSGAMSYFSKELTDLWGLGHCQTSDFTTASAEYVARYIVKKIKATDEPDHYTRIHPLTGQVCQVQPEFLIGSRRPGLGAKFTEDFKGDFYPSNFVMVDGSRRPVPGYYRDRLTEDEREVLRRGEAERRLNRTELQKNEDREYRLRTRHEVAILKVARFNRDADG